MNSYQRDYFSSAEYHREYYWRNREQIAERRHAYRVSHRQEMCEKARQRYAKNPARAQEWAHQWREKNKEKIRERSRLRYQKTRERQRANSRRFYERNREEILAKSKLRHRTYYLQNRQQIIRKTHAYANRPIADIVTSIRKAQERKAWPNLGLLTAALRKQMAPTEAIEFLQREFPTLLR